mmetsp:Transcript_4342/g.4495  ORF Transcript_4342/g.4495 Transcript_4342/m.4495 type:complete len:245 (-) Transcript_4342:4-738(-)
MSHHDEVSRTCFDRENSFFEDAHLIRIASDPILTPKVDSQCSTCKKTVSFGVFFCPHCGAVNLQNMLIKGSTTAHDSHSNLRPWKESSNHPSLNSNKGKNNFRKKTIASALSKSPSILWTSTDKPVWVPTMRQPLKKQKKIIVKPLNSKHSLSSNSQVEDFSSNIIYVDGLPYIKMDSPQHQESSLHNHETKGSKKNRDKLTLDHLAESAILSPPVLAPVSQPKHQWYERAHPLAVFDAFWLTR